MKTAVLLVVASALLGSSLLSSDAFAQSPAPVHVPPPPGLNDPGVTPAKPASTGADQSRPALPAMHDAGNTSRDRDATLPEIAVRQRGQDQIQEYSRNGQVYMVVVTGSSGIVQTYMVDPQGRLVDEHGQKPVRPVMYKMLEWGKSKPASAESSATTPVDDGQ